MSGTVTTLGICAGIVVFAAGVPLVHASTHVMPHRHVEVKAQLVVDRARHAARIELDPEEATNAAG